MACELGCCATIQKWLIFLVNITLFLFGTFQIGIASYILIADTDNLSFASDVLQGNDTAVNMILVFGILFVFISFWGCLGAVRKNKCMLWIYAFVLFLMILGQAMAVVVVGMSVEYGDSIFESLWQKLENDTITDIENTYECCSFNGNSNMSWVADVENFEDCSAINDFEPMESCWGKFEGQIDGNYKFVKYATSVFLGFQIIIYFSTHYVIQSIAESEGNKEARREIREEIEMNNTPQV